MFRGRVLVIEGDEWLGRALERALLEHGFAVELLQEARPGFQRACDVVPDCIVCATELPDIDGVWVARRIRTESSSVAKTPIVFVGDGEDKDARAQVLAVGGDVFVPRPVSNDDLVAQVSAVVAMSRRFRGGTEAPPSSTSALAAIRGDLSLFPLASILMMFEMERRSGHVEVVASSGKRATLLLVEGLFASTEIAGEPRPALEVLREVLGWRAGRFAFSPRDAGMLPAPRASVGALVLEAMRLEDENKSIPPPHDPVADEVRELVPSSAKLVAAPPRPPPVPRR